MNTPVFLTCFCLSTAVLAGDLPKDIQIFVKNADLCEHMAGEFDSGLSKRRQEEIELAVIRYCGAAQEQLLPLKSKYKNDAHVQAIISKHSYESVKDFIR